MVGSNTSPTGGSFCCRKSSFKSWSKHRIQACSYLFLHENWRHQLPTQEKFLLIFDIFVVFFLVLSLIYPKVTRKLKPNGNWNQCYHTFYERQDHRVRESSRYLAPWLLFHGKHPFLMTLPLPKGAIRTQFQASMTRNRHTNPRAISSSSVLLRVSRSVEFQSL